MSQKQTAADQDYLNSTSALGEAWSNLHSTATDRVKLRLHTKFCATQTFTTGCRSSIQFMEDDQITRTLKIWKTPAAGFGESWVRTATELTSQYVHELRKKTETSLSKAKRRKKWRKEKRHVPRCQSSGHWIRISPRWYLCARDECIWTMWGSRLMSQHEKEETRQRMTSVMLTAINNGIKKKNSFSSVLVRAIMVKWLLSCHRSTSQFGRRLAKNKLKVSTCLLFFLAHERQLQISSLYKTMPRYVRFYDHGVDVVVVGGWERKWHFNFFGWFLGVVVFAVVLDAALAGGFFLFLFLLFSLWVTWNPKDSHLGIFEVVKETARRKWVW